MATSRMFIDQFVNSCVTIARFVILATRVILISCTLKFQRVILRKAGKNIERVEAHLKRTLKFKDQQPWTQFNLLCYLGSWMCISSTRDTIQRWLAVYVIAHILRAHLGDLREQDHEFLSKEEMEAKGWNSKRIKSIAKWCCAYFQLLLMESISDLFSSTSFWTAWTAYLGASTYSALRVLADSVIRCVDNRQWKRDKYDNTPRYLVQVKDSKSLTRTRFLYVLGCHVLLSS